MMLLSILILIFRIQKHDAMLPDMRFLTVVAKKKAKE